MADILDPQENLSPVSGLKGIYTKIREMIRVLNAAVSNISTNTTNIASNTAAINALVPTYTLYEALISQAAPIPTQTSGTFTVGMIVSITTYVAGDDFSNWTLISGTANTTGAVYQVTVAAPTTWTNLSDLAYDGAPFIVSTDASNNFNPSVNTFDGVLVWSYFALGDYRATLAGAFPSDSKTYVTFGNANSNSIINGYWVDANTVGIANYNNWSVSGDNNTPPTNGDGLYFLPISIKVYP